MAHNNGGADVRYGHMVHEHALSQVREIMGERRARIAGLRTRRQAERYVSDVREAAARAFGPMPRRTALDPKLGEPRDLGAFTLQPMVYESRPGFVVTGNLYLPARGRPPHPAVVGLCGHSELGKAAPIYQAFCQGLAARGFLVLIIDPVSQGERTQFMPADLRAAGRGRVAYAGALPDLCDGHNVIGNQLALLGDFFGSWRVWDAIRAVDYLLSRPDVDPGRIGVTGNSGGGTLSTYLTALDPRLSMAAPSCFVCSYAANIENENPSDAEQNPPGIMAGGLDQVDLLLCHAPRPTMILSQHDDFFDARHARVAFEEMRRVHELLGSRSSAAWFRGPRGHGYFPENQDAMFGFFTKTAGLSVRSGVPAPHPLPTARLHAAGGTAPGARVFDFIRTEADRLAARRRRLSGADLTRSVCRVLDLDAAPPVAAPVYRCLKEYHRRAPRLRHQTTFAVQSEPGIQVIVAIHGPAQSLMHPPKGEVVVYIGHGSGQRDVEKVAAVRALTRRRIPLVVVEPRGFGTTRALTCGSRRFLEPYGADYLMACTGEMLDESLLGRRVFDTLRALDFLVDGGATGISLVGRGLGSVIAAFAAFLHSSRPRVRLLDHLESFDSLCRDPLSNWPLSSLPRGVLRAFDLPDVYRSLGKRLELGPPAGSRLDPDDMP